jgi:hypothetical protein
MTSSFAIENPRIIGLSAPMPDGDSSLSTLLTILLPLLLLLVFLVFLIVIRISSRLRRIEILMRESQGAAAELAVTKRDNPKTEQSEYEEFLREDGTRRSLSKREQSAAFREWRRQRGKTWNASEGP